MAVPMFQNPDAAVANRKRILSGYDPVGSVLYTDPESGATIDINTVPIQVVDALIMKNGPSPVLQGRKEFLQAQTDQKTADDMAEYDAVQGEVNKRTNAALRQQLDDIFGYVEESGRNEIEKNYGDQRKKLIEEEAVLGRLRSPASIGTIGDLDQKKQMALSDMIGKVQSAKATGALDVSKAIEGILAGERSDMRTAAENDKNRTVALTNIASNNENSAARNRLIAAMGGGGAEQGDDMLGGALSGTIGGAATGFQFGGPWGALAGGVAGGGLGAYGGTKSGRQSGINQLTSLFGGMAGGLSRKYSGYKPEAK